ncbi:hypothetical protein HPP92_025380 [Vanilla planifolia]|uniref:Uncharacterized protein n=1 Tax=Vanilla planifolia TaxID=51239 RepID=A0A835UC96_VANPL|nr:hypothetical protein HPP92_025380 [Vanilla planifolia]
MGGQEILQPYSDRFLWSKIYGAMKEMLLSQKAQIETLINDRDFLESYVGVQHEQWTAKEHFLESRIEQMKKEQSKAYLMESARLDVMVGSKECEARLYKLQLEFAESELEAIRTCIDSLSTDMGNLKEKADFAAADDVKQIVDPSGSSSIFDGESEKDFAWNQFKKMESEYLCLVKYKHTEVDQAKLAAEKLQGNVEKLLLSLNEKEEIIIKLEAERAMLLSDVRKHAEEVEKANNNMNRLRLDMDELNFIALEKDKIVANLREELCKLKIDLKKSSLKSSSSLNKIKSEELTSTMPKIHLQKCSSIGVRKSSGKIPSPNHRTSSRVTTKTPASEDVHKRFKKNDRNSNNNTIQQRRTSSMVAFTAHASADVPVSKGSSLSSLGKRLLFNSDFKIPKLRNSRLRTS